MMTLLIMYFSYVLSNKQWAKHFTNGFLKFNCKKQIVKNKHFTDETDI